MAATKPKKYLYIVIGLLVVAGLAFGLAKSGLLKGAFDFSGFKGGLEDQGIDTGVESGSPETIDEVAEEAATEETNAASYAATALTALEDAESAFGEYNRSNLETAQSAADKAATSAESAAEKAQSYADTAQELYDEMAAEWETYIAVLSELEKPRDDAEDDYLEVTGGEDWSDVFAAEEERDECVDEAGTNVSELAKCSEVDDDFDDLYLEACVELYSSEKCTGPDVAMVALYSAKFADTYAEAKDLYEEYQEALEDYTDYQDENRPSSSEPMAGLYRDYAQTSAENAAASATEARGYSDDAAALTLLYCNSLTLSPDSYTMAADDTEAGFDLTATIELSEEESTNAPDFTVSDFDWANLNNFVLTEIGSGAASDNSQAWTGTLIFEANGYGEFSEDEVEITEADESVTVSFSGGVNGDTILVYVEDEDDACIASFDITQAEPTDLDADDDGLTDAEEELSYHTDLNDSDSDDDGLTDYEEVITYGTDANSADSDSDGYDDADEITEGTDPNDAADYPIEIVVDTDADDDGLTDEEETAYGTDPTDTDTDDDDLSDYEEIVTFLTDPTDSDSDDGTVEDGDEVRAGTDPNDSSDDVAEEEVVEEEVVEEEIVEEEETPTTAGGIIAAREYTCSDPFSDTHGQWHEEIVCRAYAAEIVNGRTSSTFVPNDNMTRAEWIKVITLVFGLDPDDAEGKDTDFLDVSEGDWYYNYVVTAEMNDITRTRDTGYYFNPNESITRADALVFAIRAAGLSDYDYDVEATFSDVDNSDYFAYALAIANEATVTDYDDETTSIVEGYSDGTFRPYNNIARSEAMAIAIRVALAWGIASEE